MSYNSLFIKNMVCNRCVMAVESELKKFGIDVHQVVLGKVDLTEEISNENLQALKASLHHLGFEVIDDRRNQIVERIKNIVVELVHYDDRHGKLNLSAVLTEKLPFDYKYLSNLFSEVEGTTIEKYYIAQKIEKIKELLEYDELTLSEIAIRLNYSSVAYLSNQFKKETGLTPSHFKKIGREKRKSLDEV